MRILYIKAGRINEKTGGGIESYKIIYSLNKWIEKNPEDELKVISEDCINIDNTKPPKKEEWKDIISRAFFHSSYLYIDYRYKNLKGSIIGNNFDLIILGNSRLGFIAKDIKKIQPEVYIITHYDNVEYDYIDAYFLKEKGIKKYIFKKIEKISVKRDEYSSVIYSDLNILLTNRDKTRLKKLYNKKNIESRIIPICLKENQKDFKQGYNKGVNLFFIGSLWYKSNAVSIEWFLDNIWEIMKNEYPNITLTIGGNQPSEKLSLKLKSDKSIRFFPNFDRLENILFRDSILISPIQEGAGMKTKIAEALSIGFPVIASKESLVGYEEASMDTLSNGIIFEAENVNEYLYSINKIMKEDFNVLSNKCKDLFRKYYSIERASSEIERILNKIKKEKE